MTPAVLGLIAFGAVTHAAWNLAIKRSGAGGPVFTWMISVVATVVVAPVVLVVGVGDVPLGTIVLAGAGSAVLHIAYFLLLQRGYRVGDVSVVYPLARGSGPLLSVIGAIVLLGERPHPVALLGAGVIIAGVVGIGLAGGRFGAAAAAPGMLYGLLTGVAIAAYTLWDATAVTVAALAPVLLSVVSTGGQAVLLSPFVLRPGALRTALRRWWKQALLVGVLSPASYISILWAMQSAPVALVAPAREVSVVLVALAGWLILKEPHPRARITGAVVVVIGVALLALN